MRRPERPLRFDSAGAVRALRLRSNRDRTHRHFVEGLRSVFAALDAGMAVDTVVYCERLAPAIAQQRVRRAKREGIPVLRLTPEDFRSLSTAAHASGIGAVLRQHWSTLDGIELRAGTRWLATGLIRSPGNLGTMLRTAEAAGIDGVIFLGDESDPFDDRVVAASKGGIFRLRLVRTAHEEFATWAAGQGCRVVGTSPQAVADYTTISLDSPIVVIFGEERRGLSSRELELCTDTVGIHMSGRADSLNVAVAAGVVLFDLRRRSDSAR